MEKSSYSVRAEKLSLHQQQMLIQQEGNECTVPLEDIAIVVVESLRNSDYPFLFTLCIRFIRDRFIEL